uniref:Dynein light chain n=1 Tax=Oncorhynchus tshawytscha TaxID=74940 RepID=A0A8C8I4M1_ONCTS
MLCLMSDVAAEVPSNNAMPLFTSHLLYVGCNVLFYIVLLHGLGSTVHCILLHVLRHVSILDYCLPVSHACKQGQQKETSLN